MLLLKIKLSADNHIVDIADVTLQYSQQRKITSHLKLIPGLFLPLCE